MQAEAQFHVAGIKDDTTKFFMVLSQLDQRYAKEIKDVMKNPPSNDRYLKLKDVLIKRICISREFQISQLLEGEELGDRKPSQFLRHLQALANDEISEEFLRGMWSKRLPPHVQAIIVSQTGPIEEVAELADKICEVAYPSTMQVASASFHTPTASPSNFDSLLQRIDSLTRAQLDLTRQVAQLTLQDGRSRSPFRRSHAGPRGRSRSRSRSRNPGMCWYHNIFGERARKCTAPCNYQSGNKLGSQ